MVDDASTDESVRFVQRRFPWVRVLALDENRGPSAARNAALRAAASERVLFVDNDVYLPENSVRDLSEALAARPRAAASMVRCVYASCPERIQFDRPSAHFIGLQSLEPRDQPVSEGPSEPGEVTSLVSACFLLDRERLDRHVEFDPAFFIYLEDHDFGLRVRGLGHDIVAVPGVLCLHGEGTLDLSIRVTGSFTGRRVFYMIRNRWLVIAKNYRLRTLLALSPALALYEVAQVAIAVRKGWLAEWWQAASWIATHVPEIVWERRRVLRERVRPDRELLVGGPLPFRPELAAGRLERWGQGLLDRCVNGYWRLARHLI